MSILPKHVVDAMWPRFREAMGQPSNLDVTPQPHVMTIKALPCEPIDVTRAPRSTMTRWPR